MTKAEERAMEVYPPRMVYNSMMSVALKEKRDINANNRQKFIQGYVTAKQDIMDKAEKWWYEHLVGFLKEELTEGVITEFKQFMAEN